MPVFLENIQICVAVDQDGQGSEGGCAGGCRGW